MKINWGTSIVIAIAAFMGFIIFMVVTMTTNNRYTHDLVVEDYYKEELVYQKEIDKINNLKQLKGTITVNITETDVIINFPKKLNIKDITGNVIFYRPSNNKLDVSIPLQLTSHQWVFPKKNLIKGKWNMSIDFEYHTVPYLYKEDLYL